MRLSFEKRIEKVKRICDKITSEFKLSPIPEIYIAEIVLQLQKLNWFRGRNLNEELETTASAYLCMKHRKIHPKLFASISEIDYYRMQKKLKELERLFGKRMISTEDVLKLMCKNFKNSRKLTKKSIEMLNKVNGNKNYRPVVLSATLIYLSAKELKVPIRQEDFHSYGVSAVAIRSYVKKLTKKKKKRW